MSYTGRCACGAITGTFKAEPVAVRQCWCRQCQQIATGGASTNVLFPAAAIALAGTLVERHYTAASGNTVTQCFCPACGTHVTARNSGRPNFAVIRLGFLDADHGLAPGAAIWTEEAPAWAAIDPALQKFPRQPPAPAPKD